MSDIPPLDPEFGTISIGKQFDYFGIPDDTKFELSDKMSFVVIRPMMEGGRRKYLNLSNRGVKINRDTGDTQFDLRPGDDRFNLLRLSIVGWSMSRGGVAYPFTPDNLEDFLDVASPILIDDIEKKVRELNPWLTSEQSAKDVREEIERLKELLVKLEEDEVGK